MVEGLFPLLSLYALVVVRVGAALRLVPFFGGRPLPTIAWAGLSVILAAVLTPHAGPLPVSNLGSLPWMALAVKEVFIGVTLGLLARLVFSVLEIAGAVATVSTVAIPMVAGADGQRGAPLTRTYTLLGTVVFLLSGGHHALISGLAETAHCLPPAAFVPNASVQLGATPVVALFSAAMATAVLISMPVFAAGIAADVMLGLVGRLTGAAPPTGSAQALRALFVQLMVVAALFASVTIAVGFLEQGMMAIDLCPAASN
jgi:flagellar biosynthetic protein FliR